MTNATLMTVTASHLRAGVWAPQSTLFRWTGRKSRTPERGRWPWVTDVDADARKCQRRGVHPETRASQRDYRCPVGSRSPQRAGVPSGSSAAVFRGHRTVFGTQ